MSERKRRLYALEPSTSKMNYATVRHLVEKTFSADLLNQNAIFITRKLFVKSLQNGEQNKSILMAFNHGMSMPNISLKKLDCVL
jgi:ribosome biogenesis SPOUT family RNA methylase Rps3